MEAVLQATLEPVPSSDGEEPPGLPPVPPPPLGDAQDDRSLCLDICVQTVLFSFVTVIQENCVTLRCSVLNVLSHNPPQSDSQHKGYFTLHSMLFAILIPFRP